MQPIWCASRMAKSVKRCGCWNAVGRPSRSRRIGVCRLWLWRRRYYTRSSAERTRAAEARQRQAAPRSPMVRTLWKTGISWAHSRTMWMRCLLDHGQRERESRIAFASKPLWPMPQNWCKCGFWKSASIGPIQSGWAAFVTAIWGGKVQVWNVTTGEAMSPPFGQGRNGLLQPDGSLVRHRQHG